MVVILLIYLYPIPRVSASYPMTTIPTDKDQIIRQDVVMVNWSFIAFKVSKPINSTRIDIDIECNETFDLTMPPIHEFGDYAEWHYNKVEGSTSSWFSGMAVSYAGSGEYYRLSWANITILPEFWNSAEYDTYVIMICNSWLINPYHYAWLEVNVTITIDTEADPVDCDSCCDDSSIPGYEIGILGFSILGILFVITKIRTKK